MFGQPEIQVRIDELQFYFDSQEKNVIDHGRFGYKAGVALSLRHKLLNMEDRDFDIAVNAIDRLITPHAKDNKLGDQRKQFQAQRQDAQELFSAATGSSGDEVSRV